MIAGVLPVGGRPPPPPGENSMGDHLQFKNVIFNTILQTSMIFLRFLPEFRFFLAVQGHSCGNPRTGLKI